MGLRLAFTGAVRDEILDTETLACHLAAYLGERYPEALKTGYKLAELPAREEGEDEIAWGCRLLEAAGSRRGFRISGGEIARGGWQKPSWMNSAAAVLGGLPWKRRRNERIG